jgi:site-specific DNA-methyltransferase (adenine-specific)
VFEGRAVTWTIHQGDALEVLRTLPDRSVNCCVTSPPYWRLRDYGVAGQIGDEPTIEEYLGKLVAVFREVRRVLHADGVLWLNMGDGYVSDAWGGGGITEDGCWSDGRKSATFAARMAARKKIRKPTGLKRKDMIGLPWRLAFAMQQDGWYLRSDTIWAKTNPHPEAVKDRPTKAHEYIFLLSKRRRYYYDAEAIKDPVTENAHPRGNGVNPKAKRDAERAFNRRRKMSRQNPSFSSAVTGLVETRNARTVWTFATQGRDDDHYATFPDELPRRCILAGCPPGGTVLDPFVGRGTTVIVALRNQRHGIGIDLSPEYCEMARENIVEDAPLLNIERAETIPPSPAPAVIKERNNVPPDGAPKTKGIV